MFSVLKMMILKDGGVERRRALTQCCGDVTDTALLERSGQMARALKILIPLDAVWTICKNLLSESMQNCRERSLSQCYL